MPQHFFQLDSIEKNVTVILMLAATLKDDRTTLTHWTEIQTDNYLDSIVQTKGRTIKPTASCFNFSPTAQKNLKFTASPHWHIYLCPQPHQPTLGQRQKSQFCQRSKRKRVSLKFVTLRQKL